MAAPATAANVIHKYVGALRRLLEPGLPARATRSWPRRDGRAGQERHAEDLSGLPARHADTINADLPPSDRER
ncbi:hypothetical protein ACQP2X_12775 [Actinoplanes sp. CA-131856]